MRLTTKGRYAVTAMLDLALHATEGPVPLAEISQRQGISLSYLEQLFSRLRRQELVKSARGPGGGYRLARGADTIAVVDIINAIDENVNVTRCGGRGDCQDGEPCLTHELWCDLSRQIHEFLGGIHLAELIERHSIRQINRRQEGLVRQQEQKRELEQSMRQPEGNINV